MVASLTGLIKSSLEEEGGGLDREKELGTASFIMLIYLVTRVHMGLYSKYLGRRVPRHSTKYLLRMW